MLASEFAGQYDATKRIIYERFRCVYCGDFPYVQQSPGACAVRCFCGRPSAFERGSVTEALAEWNRHLKEVSSVMASDAGITLDSAPIFIHYPYAYVRYIAKETLAGRKHSIELFSYRSE